MQDDHLIDRILHEAHRALKHGMVTPEQLQILELTGALAALENEDMDQIKRERFASPEALPNEHEREVLTILVEECAEVAQRGTKAMRFGVQETQPGQPYTNAYRLGQELGDLLVIAGRAVELGLIDPKGIEAGKENKVKQLKKFMQTAENSQPEAAAKPAVMYLVTGEVYDQYEGGFSWNVKLFSTKAEAEDYAAQCTERAATIRRAIKELDTLFANQVISWSERGKRASELTNTLDPHCSNSEELTYQVEEINVGV